LTEHTGWPTSVISHDTSPEARFKALQNGPYGRCVYYCDNDVVDHQVVALEFANAVTATFTMSGFTRQISRTLRLMGTEGEMRGDLERNEIEIRHFASGGTELLALSTPDGQGGHAGGDFGLMRAFLKLLQSGSDEKGLTSAAISVQSHLMALAAEQARREKRVITLQAFREQCTLPA
jgi:predicted dehydrogenase